jgi:hypothetical protein
MWSLFRRLHWPLILVFALAATLNAQRRYAVGPVIDLVGGGSNRPAGAISLGSGSQRFFLFYGVYPSITMTSRGARSVVDASYAFGLNRTETDQSINSQSHTASLRLSTRVSPSWNVSLSESFTATSDAATFNALRGVPRSPEDPLVFNPVAIHALARTNNTSILADYTLSDKSAISISGAHTVRNYSGLGTTGGGLSDQQHTSGGIAYARTVGHAKWSLGYTGSYFDFANFSSTQSHVSRVGYSDRIVPGLTFQVNVGVSYLKSRGAETNYVGYNTSASLQKTITGASFSMYYTQDSGRPTGLGSISDARRVGLTINRAGRNATLFVDVSVFDTRGSLGNIFNTRGASAAANFGIPLTRTVSLQAGAQYQRQNSTLGFTQKRLFVSLRYNNPNLWTFLK